MAATTNEVESILGTDLTSGADLTQYVRAAASVVSQMTACAVRKGYSHTTEDLDVIHAWLSAWAYCQMDRQYLERKTADSRGKFNVEPGKGLESNSYGQTALLLDGSGCLSSMSKMTRGRLVWLGKPESQQLSYQLRNG